MLAFAHTMIFAFYAVFANFVVFEVIRAQWAPFVDQKCRTNAYTLARAGIHDDYSPSAVINETFVVNLDLPPEQRWSHIVMPKRNELRAVIDTFKQIIPFDSLRRLVFWLIDRQLPNFLTWLPVEYGREIRGIANDTGIEIGEVIFVNIFYEFSSLCTSIIARSQRGAPPIVVHGRNLDFGMYPFVGWNSNNNTWKLTEHLKPLTVNVEFFKTGKLLFKTVQFAGYVGVITGVRPNAFSLSLNTRFELLTGWFNLLRWFTVRSGLSSGWPTEENQPVWLGFATRDALQNAQNFHEARKQLKSAELFAPVYFILSGHDPMNASNSDGCIITRSPRTVIDERCLSMTQGSYLVQTNDDWWKSPAILDDRRTPAFECLGEAMSNETTPAMLVEDVYNVLSTKPVLNKLTSYTSLMRASDGFIESYKRDCADPCWPW